MKIRYFKYKNSRDYYVVCGERVILVTESGYMKKTNYDVQEIMTNHSMGLIIEIPPPNAENIESRHIWPEYIED